ncbi:hypothetical protein ACFOQM_04175 [Paenibacillus sp. GCM10012307]|uniref:ParM/StbA family protein n=1 Tax=Paenibacillus roseus TaxID=2798579 RepID=A0A934J0J8_9BACL|nr:ParM/StbA family protein [Paenibacillus roseus]MBJ6360510.1 ParM/StbA family protein [Paenibacillus roseus]
MRISVDIGFGYVKAENEEGKSILFPSVVGLRRASNVAGVFGEQFDDYIVTIKKGDEDQNSYYVGDAGLTSGGTRTWEDEHAKNRNLEVLIATAMGILNEKEEPVELAVGLPMNVFSAQHEELKRKLTGLSLDVSVEGERQPKNSKIQVSSVFVFPQGAGAYYAALHNIDGSVKDANLLNKPLAVIEIGFRTTDFLFMSLGKRGLQPRPEPFTGSLDIGMNTAQTEIQQAAKKELGGYEPDLKEIEKALLWPGMNGILTAKGKSIDLKPFRKQANENVASRIISQLKQRWRDEVNTLSSVMIGGGGGDDLYSHFEQAFGITQKVENPQFANAKGFLAAQALALRAAGRG